MATELAKAYVQIVPSAQGIKGSISNALGGEADSAGVSSGKTFASRMVSVIKGTIVAAGIGKALSASISEGANLEQSIGGIETLFKDSANKVNEYAANAYKTAGLSANDYMQTVTGFSASLLQGLGGDTMKAAEISNMAITDMSDNANKMGTSMESIQSAYQGFAKQNYTMLDNLKLGYGGTKTEMERLLSDAQKLTGVKYDISNLSDVYSAIHAIQTELDITGTTAKEAASTISGSSNAMKSAFKNVLGNMALGEDIKPAMKALVDSASVYLFDNLLPAVGNVFLSIPDVLTTAIQTGIPILKENGVKLITDVVSGAYQAFPQMYTTAFDMITNFAVGILNNLPQMLENGKNILSTIIAGLKEMYPAFIVSAGEMITTIITGLINNFPAILSSGIDLIVTLVKGLGSALPEIIKAAGNVALQIKETIKNVDWLKLGKDIIQGMIDGIGSMAGALWDAAVNIAKSALDAIKSFFGIKSPSRLMRDEVGKFIPMGLAEGITSNSSYVQDAMDDLSKTASGELNDRLSYNLKGESANKAISGHSNQTNLYQTINTHDKLSPAELTQEAQDFLQRSKWRVP